MAKPLKDLLTSILAPEKTDDWRLHLLHHWQTIIGNLHARVRLEKIVDDTLIVGVYDSHWMHELHALSRVIIRKINQQLGHAHVSKLHFKLVELQTREISPKKEVIQAIKPARSFRLSEQQKEALQQFADLELQQYLQTFLKRCLQD
jgi:hypothetical protein